MSEDSARELRTASEVLETFEARADGFDPHEVAEAVRAQLAKGLAFGWMHESEVALAELLCARVPSFESVRFTSSGTESTMYTLLLARAYTG